MGCDGDPSLFCQQLHGIALRQCLRKLGARRPDSSSTRRRGVSWDLRVVGARSAITSGDPAAASAAAAPAIAAYFAACCTTTSSSSHSPRGGGGGGSAGCPRADVVASDVAVRCPDSRDELLHHQGYESAFDEDIIYNNGWNASCRWLSHRNGLQRLVVHLAQQVRPEAVARLQTDRPVGVLDAAGVEGHYA